ncbi:Smr/MutS family protein [uncultured Tenacibaculum sp.]|uniref:Smr/MutS family protein n=1 Tax=uncultured Tenacibaculum sp. TaxID=174713 RepID=UPI002616AF43|nr:Smr/MutS family protein [uncultured Tenacibaculum sp.]
MCLEIGNKVAVIDDIVKGIVTKLDNDFVFVKDDSGMEFRFLRSELVKIEMDQNDLTKYSDINNSLLREKQKEKKKKKTQFIKQRNEVVMEVDLHVEKLVKSIKGLDNFDILTLQVNTAKAKLEYCIRNRISKVVFIHGVGEGVLRTELNYLFNNYPVTYSDASYNRYGLGATEVYIFQNSI